MFTEICRLCLSTENLQPLFKNCELINEFSCTLLLTTGLKIDPNDGFPQQLCGRCSKDVDCALELRNRSQYSEKQLLDQRNSSNIVINNKTNEPITNKDNKNINSDEDRQDITGLQDTNLGEQSDTSQENGAETKWPPVKKLSKKDKRQMYLDLVDGPFDPNGPVKCKICKNTVSKWTCFLRHVKLHLGFNFMCEFCGKSFITTTKLNRHCRSHHGMKRELKCSHCSYLALDNAQLKLHERRVHTGERPYVCDICASSYHSRRCLVQHIESHRTVATVQCPSCPQVLKSSRALARHRYSAHAHSRAHCPHCARAYSRKYLNVHISRHHTEIIDNLQ